jgi:hypothetical protein
VWEASTLVGPAAISYELEYGTDPAFAPPLATTVMTGFTNHQPSVDLGVSAVAPVGARYYWHVRACAGSACSAFSPTWWVNVGRSDHDLNGDGYADVTVGAPDNDDAASNAGALYVYFGGPTGALDTTPDGIIMGSVASDAVGIRHAMVGDLNGDGFTDLVVRPFMASTVDVYSGGAGASFDTTPDSSFLASTGAVAVYVPRRAGDLNSDGYDDLLMTGLNLADSAAAAVIYLGGPAAFDTAADGTFIGSPMQGFLPKSISGGGDVNGDGYADFVFGESDSDAGGTDSGEARLYLGGPVPLSTSAAAVIAGTAPSELLGSGSALDADVNDDGFADLALAAAGVGEIRVFLGGPGAALDVVADGVGSVTATDFLGVGLTAVGDVNGDGLDDLAAHAVPVGGGPGSVYLFLGASGTTFDGVADATFVEGTQTEDNFGASIAGAGDTNGDGVDDLVLGMPQCGAGVPVGTGDAFVYLGGSATPLDTVPDTTLVGAVLLDCFGQVVQ